MFVGGAVAEWSKTLLVRENNRNYLNESRKCFVTRRRDLEQPQQLQEGFLVHGRDAIFLERQNSDALVDVDVVTFSVVAFLAQGGLQPFDRGSKFWGNEQR